ncbi:ATP-binding cassette, subfamily B [Aliiroseovarius crassostreae]|uniref:ABC transporter n=1 Tax=Aliiroseovarius crassostreae TaxID=154981 RepID=A0A0P7I2Z6_9RHOB|nr:ABC transporter transmembrane domain-containing protein [Aliiroseovarius crassostreae]KPN63449.1 ABC transporter [Aliiroseovarius crassostreae]SFU79717.1 ATP-binding cassette, subfamily B [Aliiroseovarius crassostreae]
MARRQNAGMDIDKREKSKRIGALSGLWPFMAPHKLWILGAFAALVFTAGISLILPIAVRRVVDGFDADGGAGHLLDKYFVAALAVAGLLALGTGLRYYLVTRLGERVVADIRKAVFDRVVGMSPAFYERIMTGEVLSRITTDTTLILSVIGSSVSVALRNMFIFLGGLILMLFTSAKLTGLVLLLVPIVVVPIIILGRRLRNLGRENQEWIAKSSGNASESLLSVQTVQAFTHEDLSRREFADLTEESFDSARIRITTRAIMTVIVITLIFSGVVGILWIGMHDVTDGGMSIGALVQFVIYSVMVAGAVGALSEIWSELQRAAGATERLVELLNAEDKVQDPAEPKLISARPEGAISFKDVTFHYPSRPHFAALEGITLEVKPGETVALVGPSGAGKSTIIQLLERFYDPDSGSVELDGVDLRDMRRDDFRKYIAMVPQDAVVFATSARENIRFGRPDASDAEVEAAARAAAAHEFLTSLPDGYDTYVGERGVMLSGGQKQRIAIARAILRDAPVLLLDEATSALDAESERLVQAAVDELAQGRTTLIVAHRLATVKKADRIVVFEEGRIVAQGTHDELVEGGGLYARLAKLQFTEGGA